MRPTRPTRPGRPEVPPSHDRDEFAEFYRAHVDAVVAFAAKRSRQSHDVADICSAVFARALVSLDGYDHRRGTPRLWLLGICAKVHAEWHRREFRELRIAERLAAQAPLDEDDVERFDSMIDAHAVSRDLIDALEGLPTNQRIVVELVAIDDLTPTEAAHALGISPGTARVRLSRARRSLRGTLVDAAGHTPSDRRKEAQK